MSPVSTLSQQNGAEWGSQDGPTTETKSGFNDLSEAEVALQRLVDCYRATDDTNKIPEINQVSREGLAMTVEGTEQRPIWSHALAWSLYQSYKYLDASEVYIEEAVSLERKAIESALDSKDIDKSAGAALRLGKQPSDALSILEQGRGLLASSVDEIRPDIKELRAAFPDLAEQFIQLRDELDPSTGRRRRDAGKAFDELLLQIQERHGFEDFLGPLTTDRMVSAADCGPVVVLKSSWMGVDAIIIQKDQLMSLVFTEVKDFQTLQFMPEHEYGNIEALEILWTAFIKDILEHLGFTETPADGQDWSHIWWIPTGPLSRLPIHAAGLHLEMSGKTVMDRVISSYAPSVKTLVHGRRRQGIQKGPSQALLVAMESTQSQAPLPKAKEEVDLVSKICQSMNVTPVIAGSDKKEVLEHLRSSKIFHFAGHGYIDRSNPSKSHLCFSNASDPLTVADLPELNLHEESPFLAYLSACSTGRVQDEQFIDESIHLISACQLAGFRHIIGTLWKVQDEHCVDVARITYETIRENSMSDNPVCRGLHRATRAMRDVWLDKMEEDGNSALRGG